MSEQQQPAISIDDFRRWLRDVAGVGEWRRIVRDDGERLLVSKFEEGFAAGVHDLIAQVPELLDEPAVRDAYEQEATAATGTSRVDAWHRGLHAMLRAAGERHSIPNVRQAELRTGIDSVYAILQTLLWTDPQVGQPYQTRASERSAYHEVIESMDKDHDMFTRVYGWYETRQVVNHCPGAPFARVMLEQGWRVSSGEDVPGQNFEAANGEAVVADAAGHGGQAATIEHLHQIVTRVKQLAGAADTESLRITEHEESYEIDPPNEDEPQLSTP
jgi:hypothetical protein